MTTPAIQFGRDIPDESTLRLCGDISGGKRAIELGVSRQVNAIAFAHLGAKAIAVPSDQGMDRALWAVPVAILIAAAGGLFVLGKRWRDRGALETAPEGPEASDYDARLDDELSRRSEDA